MDIGKRLRELRIAKDLSQGDIERRTGLLRCYVSRVEHGHTVPTLGTLERWAKALDVKLYELFLEDTEHRRRLTAKLVKPVGPQEQKLFRLITRMKEPEQRMLLSLGQKLSARAAKRK